MVYLQMQLRASRALLKFCEEHHYDTSWLSNIRACIAALESNEIEKAWYQFLQVPIGGHGCFNDWFPPVVYEHETGEYAWEVFEALVYRWNVLMRSSM